MQLGATTSQNMEGLVRCQTSTTSSTRMGVALRFTASNTFYHARLSANANNLVIGKVVTGTNTDLFTTAFTVSVATNYWIRFRVVGTNLYAKVWADGGSEPGSWTLTGTDSSISGSGGFGLTINASSTAVTWDFDSFTVTDATTTMVFPMRAVISTQATKIFKLRAPISTLNTKIFKLRAVLTNNTVTKIFKLRAPVRTLNTTIFKLRAKVFGQNTKIFKLRAPIRTQNTSIFKLRTKVSITTTKIFKLRAPIRTQNTKIFQLRLVAKAPPLTSGGFTLFANGTGTVKYKKYRTTQYPDPALSLSPVLPRLGTSSASWNANTPTNTSLTVRTSLDGVNWSTATSGSSIPGLNGQTAPVIDVFTTNTSANYTSTNKSGGSTATPTFDTANSRLTLVGGSNALYLSSISDDDAEAIADMDRSDAGGLVLRYIDQSNFYYLTVADDHASVGTPNTMTLYRVGYSSAIIADAPLAYYRLGEASGTSATDSSGNGKTGTYANAGITYSQTGAINTDTNTAVLFNGSSGKMTLPASVNPESGSFSFECWLKVASYPGTSNSILANYNTPSSNIGAGFGMNTSGQVNWTVVNGSGSFVSITSSAISTGVWHHIVGTYDGSASKFYFDGSLVGSTTTTFTANSTDAIQVGSSPYGDFYTGSIDEVAIYSSALSLSRVQAHYNSATTAPTTQLATAAISWPRSTSGSSPYRTIRATMLGSVITAYLDGSQILTYTDTGPLPAGKIGLFNNGGTSRYYQLRIQQQGDYVAGTPSGDVVTGGFVYTQATMSTTDPSVTPQLLDLTTSARSPQIETGALITQLHDPSDTIAEKFNDEVDSLTQTSGDFWWNIANDGSATFSSRHATKAPFPIYSTDLLYKPDVQPAFGADLYRNRQTIRNCLNTIDITDEQKIADGSASSWSMSYQLYSAPTITVNNVGKTVGVSGTDTGKDFYWTAGSYTISQDTSATPVTSGYIIKVSYTGQYKDIVTRDNLAEQAAQKTRENNLTTGIVEAVEDGKGMLVSNATSYADGLLARYSNPNPVEIKFTTLRSGLQPGMIQPYFIPEFQLNNRQLLIMNMSIKPTQEADGSILYEYAVTASDGSNTNNWLKALKGY